MSMLTKIAAAGSAVPKTYVDDVFSAYTYVGNGSALAITNGIDLAGKGGLVWSKLRDGSDNHYLSDTVRGANRQLSTSNTNPEMTIAGVHTAFNSNGYSIGNSSVVNQNGNRYTSWTFRKAPKFFDAVTYTGNGVAGRTVAHNLGVDVGLAILKRIDSTGGDWPTMILRGANVYACGIFLNLTTAQQGSSHGITPNSYKTVFQPEMVVGDVYTQAEAISRTNANGGRYVAYLFAHDTSVDGLIQCGSFVGNANANGPVVNLGWEPQFVLIKNLYAGSTQWVVMESSMGMCSGSNDEYLIANGVSASAQANYISPTSTGFQIVSTSDWVNGNGHTMAYMAIRRPNKPPTSGTQVYSAISRTGTGASATISGVGFAPDTVISKNWGPASSSFNWGWFDRIRGPNKMFNTAAATRESSQADQVTEYLTDGVKAAGDAYDGCINKTSLNYNTKFLKRAPGVFDVVCFNGTGANNQRVKHGLGVVPELIIVRDRVGDGVSWEVYHSALPSSHLVLNAQAAASSAVFNAPHNLWGTTPATHKASDFGVDTYCFASTLTNPCVAWLFATLPGVSKVGNYTGNGSSHAINCGFSTGARFIMIKRTDASGDWYVWDSLRGITSGNDPHLSFNKTDWEVTTDDSVDPDAGGFAVNQVAATNINVVGANYIFLAIA